MSPEGSKSPQIRSTATRETGVGRFRGIQKSVSTIPRSHLRRQSYSYLLSTYFVSVSALDAEDSGLGKAVSLPSENDNLEREKR